MMMLRLALVSALMSGVLGNPLVPSMGEGMTPRHLEEDYSWMSGYTVKYENCFADAGMVSFRLCPSDDTCESGCTGGGQYLAELYFFVDAYTEAQLGAREYACEMVRENCDDDEDVCYANAGMNYCIDNDDENDFDVQEYLECQQLDDDVYVGPYCSSDDAVSIYLGVFTDEGCVTRGDDSAFYDLMGYVLPYSATSEHAIIEDDCANCKEHPADQNDGDQQDEDDVLEQCEQLYEGSSKCEEDIEVDDPDLSACDYISQLYDEEEALRSTGGGPSWSTWGLVIGVAVAVLACCGLSFFAYQRMNKNKKGAVETTGPSKNRLI